MDGIDIRAALAFVVPLCLIVGANFARSDFAVGVPVSSKDEVAAVRERVARRGVHLAA